MKWNWRGPLLAACVLMLAACASGGGRKSAPPPLDDPEDVAAAQARQATREAWLRGQPEWGFEARVAVSQAGKGGSGRLDWRQRGAQYTASLSAPVTRQSWRLSAGAEGAELEGLEGGPRRGDDADLLLREATGWDIPVQTLSEWARGLSGQGSPEFGPEGQLQALRQAGWTIRYTEWLPAAGAQPAMPRRIEAERGQARVRLIVDRWDLEATP